MTQQLAALACMVIMMIWIAVVHRRGVTVSRLFQQLHPHEYANRGSPHASYRDIMANARFDRFIFSRAYRNFGDPEFIAACDKLRLYDFSVIAVIVLTLIFALCFGGFW
jgi:hypothetical protein